MRGVLGLACSLVILVSLAYFFEHPDSRDAAGRRRLACKWAQWKHEMQCSSSPPKTTRPLKSETLETHTIIPVSTSSLVAAMPKGSMKPSLGKVTGHESPGTPWPHSVNVSQSLNWLSRTVLLVGPTHTGRENLLSQYEPHVASLVHVFVSPSTEKALNNIGADCKFHIRFSICYHSLTLYFFCFPFRILDIRAEGARHDSWIRIAYHMAALDNQEMLRDATVLPHAPLLRKLLSTGKELSGFFYCHADYWFHPALFMHSQWSEDKLWYPDHICTPATAERYPDDMRIYENAWNTFL